MKYLLNYDDIKNWKIYEIREKIDKIEGLPLSDCTISKLVFYNDVPILTGNGVYIFKKGEDYLYVGKCSSRCFAERIPAHFDLRNDGWFNNFLKRLVNMCLNQQNKDKIKDWKEPLSNKKTDEYIDLITKQASSLLQINQESFLVSNHKLILINFAKSPNIVKAINDLEYILRIVLKPLNEFKTIKTKDINVNQKICDFKKK